MLIAICRLSKLPEIRTCAPLDGGPGEWEMGATVLKPELGASCPVLTVAGSPPPVLLATAPVLLSGHSPLRVPPLPSSPPRQILPFITADQRWQGYVSRTFFQRKRNSNVLLCCLATSLLAVPMHLLAKLTSMIRNFCATRCIPSQG